MILRAALWVVMVTALIGAVIAADLTYVHYKTFTDAAYHSFCAISDAWNCQAVALSEYSVFLRIPVSLWGLLVYLVYIFLAAVGLRDATAVRREGIRGLGLLLVMAVCGATVSAFLYYVSEVIVKSKCILCLGLHIVNAVIFLVMIVLAVGRRDGPFRWFVADLRGILLKPGVPLVGLGIAAVVAVAAVAFYPRLYGGRIDCEYATTLREESSLTQACNREATYGTSNPVLIITEFSDYECPYCAITHFALRRAVDRYRDKVMLKHRHFPLDKSCNPLLRKPFHKAACLAAKAAICGGKQNKFWELNDLLYMNQRVLGRDRIMELAASVKLDMEAFKRCLDDPATAEVIEADIQAATNTPFVQSGMIGTPIIYVGDRPHIGALSFEEVVKIVEEELTSSPSTVASSLSSGSSHKSSHLPARRHVVK